MCSLARHIGHTERSFQQYVGIRQLWNIQRNQEVKKNKEDAKRDAIINKNVGDDFLPKRKFEYYSASESIDTKNQLQFRNSESSINSEDDAEMIKNNPLVFVDYKLMKIQEKKRQAGFCHIITSIVRERDTNKYQSFTRGEASVIFNDCTDFWDGEQIEHISNSMRADIKATLAQWNEQYETIGFSYKPFEKEIHDTVLEKFFENNCKLRESKIKTQESGPEDLKDFEEIVKMATKFKIQVPHFDKNTQSTTVRQIRRQLLEKVNEKLKD